MRKFLPIIIPFGIVLVAAGIIAAQYNAFVDAKLEADTAWADVETQYQRRVDLIPNLVSTVRGAANFERETFTAVTEARSGFSQARQLGDREGVIQAAQGLDGAIGRLLVTVEDYPDLRATQSFNDLMAQLEGTENRIAVARRDYNNAVLRFNRKVQRFPGRLFAGWFGFDTEPFFEAQEGSEQAPVVDFDS